MPMNVKISENITKDLNTVYQAIVNKDQLCCYFTSSASANLNEANRIFWEWADFNVKCEITNVETKENKEIKFNWSSGSSPKTVLIKLTAISDEVTKVDITESEFEFNQGDVKTMLGQTQGWTNFVCCLKAYLYAGINLRK